MNVEIYEQKGAGEGYRIECRTYELPDGLRRILCGNLPRSYAPTGAPWGFDADGRQHEGRLVSLDPSVVIVG